MELLFKIVDDHKFPANMNKLQEKTELKNAHKGLPYPRRGSNMSARLTKEKKGFTTVLLRLSSPLPPKAARPAGEGVNAPVRFLPNRARPERIRENLQETLMALG